MIREALDTLNEATFKIAPTRDDLTYLKLEPSAKEIVLAIYDNFKKLTKMDWDKVLPITHAGDSNKIKYAFLNSKELGKLMKSVNGLSKIKKYGYDLDVRQNGVSFKLGRKVILSVTNGQGSRNAKAGGGSAGMVFEDALVNDLKNLQTSPDTMLHKSIVDELVKEVKKKYRVDLGKEHFTVRKDGGKNQKRNITFDGKKWKANPSGDIGHILTDVSIITKKKEIFLSLKYTKQFFITNFSIKPYLGELRQVDTKRDEMLMSLGLNPFLWGQHYSAPGVDKQIPESQAVKNIEQLLEEVVGYGYIKVIGGGKYDVVADMKKGSAIKITSGLEFRYAGRTRKGSAIVFSMDLGGHHYNVQMQIRGTKSTDGPNYVRVLLTQ